LTTNDSKALVLIVVIPLGVIGIILAIVSLLYKLYTTDPDNFIIAGLGLNKKKKQQKH